MEHEMEARTFLLEWEFIGIIADKTAEAQKLKPYYGWRNSVADCIANDLKLTVCLGSVCYCCRMCPHLPQEFAYPMP